MASSHPNVPETPSRNADNVNSSLMQPPPRLMTRNSNFLLHSLGRNDDQVTDTSKMPGQLFTPAWLRNGNDNPNSPAITPADGRDISLRMIHFDTKACLEKFSERLNTLITGFEQSLSEIKISGKLIETNYEKAVADIVDVVNRSQTMIIDSIKAQQVFTEKLDGKLDNLDTKYETISTLQQQQSQLLQTLTQSLQTIQEQQYEIIKKFSPLEDKLENTFLKSDLARDNILLADILKQITCMRSDETRDRSLIAITQPTTSISDVIVFRNDCEPANENPSTKPDSNSSGAYGQYKRKQQQITTSQVSSTRQLGTTDLKAASDTMSFKRPKSRIFKNTGSRTLRNTTNTNTVSSQAHQDIASSQEIFGNTKIIDSIIPASEITISPEEQNSLNNATTVLSRNPTRSRSKLRAKLKGPLLPDSDLSSSTTRHITAGHRQATSMIGNFRPPFHDSSSPEPDLRKSEGTERATSSVADSSDIERASTVKESPVDIRRRTANARRMFPIDIDFDEISIDFGI